MTCVVGLVDNEGGVHFGCDSLGTDGHSGTIISDPKIFQVGEFLIGYAGSYRLGQLLQYSLVIPGKKEEQTSRHFLCTDFVDAVRITFELGHFYKESRDDEAAGFDGEFIVGYRGEIFLIQGDFSVLHAVEDFTSAGSGAETSNAVLSGVRSHR
jgi:ATP-dependent protease HslVU (ClpYQ) peptidase subunit